MKSTVNRAKGISWPRAAASRRHDRRQRLPAYAQSAADRAVEAAKQYSGTTINVLYEAGLQPLDPKTFTGPMWEELTGIKVNVIEAPLPEIFTKTMQAHRAGSGAYDVLNVVPATKCRTWRWPVRSTPLDAYGREIRLLPMNCRPSLRSTATTR